MVLVLEKSSCAVNVLTVNAIHLQGRELFTYLHDWMNVLKGSGYNSSYLMGLLFCCCVAGSFVQTFLGWLSS